MGLFKVKTKFKLGDEFEFKPFWLYQREKYGDRARINSVLVTIREDGYSIIYGMEISYPSCGTWMEMASGANLSISEENLVKNDNSSSYKKKEGFEYNGELLEFDIKYEIGDTLVSSINGEYKNGLPHIGHFCGNIFTLDVIKYKKSLRIRQRLDAENNMELDDDYKNGLFYCRKENSSIIFDGFCGRINNGENCRWLNSGDDYRIPYIESLKNINVDKYIDEVVKYAKKEKDKLIPPDEYIGEYELNNSWFGSKYYMFFKALGKEKDLVETYNSYKTVVVKREKKSNKKDKVSEIMEGLSENDKKKLLKQLLKDAKG